MRNTAQCNLFVETERCKRGLLGVTLWLVYGVIKSDWIIMAANGVSLVLLCGTLFFELPAARASRS